jgi:uncharacterized membrane protein YsdA (DUF1294 family)
MTYRFSLILFTITFVLAALMMGSSTFGPLLSWLTAINLVTFFTYGYDKLVAWLSGMKAPEKIPRWLPVQKMLGHFGTMRVPENVLLGMAALGGTLAAGLGMLVFRHKVSKGPFLRKFWLVVAVQVVLLGVFFAWVRPYFTT